MRHRREPTSAADAQTLERHRNFTRRWKYGLTVDELEEIKARACCDLCGTTAEPRGGWQVDHCHETGRIRGALCRECNLGLGLLGDSLEALERAWQYLARSEDA